MFISIRRYAYQIRQYIDSNAPPLENLLKNMLVNRLFLTERGGDAVKKQVRLFDSAIINFIIAPDLEEIFISVCKQKH